MNNLATIEPRRKSVTMDMADRYGMDHVAFERTLRATVFPQNAPAEEFAAFLLVAKEYKLNPITKEIYAFPKRGGGIVPIVSIDGWLNLINSHPAFDGMDFEDINEDGKLSAIKCTIYRKDRSHPVSVTEYLDECYRPTDPWKMKHRMLRHKAAIQCARYAFSLSGIYDEDEGEKIAQSAPPRPALPTPPVPPPVVIEAPKTAEQFAAAVNAMHPDAEFAAAEVDEPDYETIRAQFKASAESAKSYDELQTLWEAMIDPHYERFMPPDQEDITGIFRHYERTFEG